MEKVDSKEIEKRIKEIIFQFLNPSKYKIFIFGSRLTNKARKFSDYDVGIISRKPVPGDVLVMIEEAMEESDLPYKVDIVDFSLVSPNFRKIALSETKPL